jgi:hypothetical protein
MSAPMRVLRAADAAWAELYEMLPGETRTLFLTARGYIRTRRLAHTDIELGTYLPDALREVVLADAIAAWDEHQAARQREGCA